MLDSLIQNMPVKLSPKLHRVVCLNHFGSKRKPGLEAVEQFERVLDLSKDANLGVPEVEDTRKRLAELKGNDILGGLVDH
jgi:hypothetical protein